MSAHWPQPLVSVDVVAYRWRWRAPGEGLAFALHHRPNAPFQGRAALPGVLLAPGESLRDAAKRALTTKLGIDAAAFKHLAQFGAFDESNRDPRGATISIGHLAVLSSDDQGMQQGYWVPGLTAETELPFDHNAILAAAAATLRHRLWSDWELTRALLGEEFTTKGALALSRALDALPNRASNLARWLESTGKVDRLGSRGRDTVWRWVE